VAITAIPPADSALKAGALAATSVTAEASPSSFEEIAVGRMSYSPDD
jgi:hypothetical protein